MKLQGIFPPITTPFDHDGEIWKVKVQHNIEKWNRTGLAGYVVCGSTGESVMLTTEEKIQLWEWVAQYAAPGEIADRRNRRGERARNGGAHQPRRRARLQGGDGPNAALLQEPAEQRRGPDALLPRSGRSSQDPGDHL